MIKELFTKIASEIRKRFQRDAHLFFANGDTKQDWPTVHLPRTIEADNKEFLSHSSEEVIKRLGLK